MSRRIRVVIAYREVSSHNYVMIRIEFDRYGRNISLNTECQYTYCTRYDMDTFVMTSSSQRNIRKHFI